MVNYYSLIYNVHKCEKITIIIKGVVRVSKIGSIIIFRLENVCLYIIFGCVFIALKCRISVLSFQVLYFSDIK